MNKQILSNYGWIVIVTLVLGVMLTFATPFGNYTGKTFVDITSKFINSNNQALSDENLEKKGEEWGLYLQYGKTNPEDIFIADGATYTCVDGTVLNAGDVFPSLKDGDVYNHTDYEYTYKSSYNGWGVRCVNNTAEPCAILKSINEKPIVNMYGTFQDCTALTTIPTIPNTVKDMSYAFYKCKNLTNINGLVIPKSVTSISNIFRECTALTDLSGLVIPNSVRNISSAFSGCTSLTVAPKIPDSITEMTWAFFNCTKLTKAPLIPNKATNISNVFYGCTSLTGSITINSTPTSYTNCLKGTKITKILGDCTIKEKILATK